MNYATPLKAEDYFPGNEKDIAKEVDEQIMYSTSTFTKRGKKMQTCIYGMEKLKKIS